MQPSVGKGKSDLLDLYHISSPQTVSSDLLQTKEHYEKVLEDVTAYTPRYMEEMEAIFDQSQEEERKRISFLKQAFLSIHRHLDVTNNERWDAGRVSEWTTGLIRRQLIPLCSVPLCQREDGVQWPPPNADVNQRAGGSQVVEEQLWSRHAHQLAEDWGAQKRHF